MRALADKQAWPAGLVERDTCDGDENGALPDQHDGE